MIQDHCGIVALYSPEPEPLLGVAIEAARGVQHRGLQGVGILIDSKKNNHFTTYTRPGLIREVFDRPLEFAKDEETFDINDSSKIALVHTRYGTSGAYNKANLQPCRGTTKAGTEVAVIHNGQFAGVSALRKTLKKKLPKEASDTLIFTQALAEEAGATWDVKIISLLAKVSGAYSLAIAVKENNQSVLYLARDAQGIRPLLLGKNSTFWMAASETHPFDKVGAKVIRQINRGEIVRIDTTGPHAAQGFKKTAHYCDFEWAYIARPNALIPTTEAHNKHPEKWLSVYEFRVRCGEILAEEQPIELDMVIGVPDSGTAVGMGYARKTGIPYEQIIIRDHHDQDGDKRLFMGDDQIKAIQSKVLGKLSLVPNPKLWQGKKIALADDSIIRGNVSIALTKALKKLGAKEVHWLVGFPMVRYPCHLGVSMRAARGNELIAARNQGNVKKITTEIGADSVRYISPRGFIKARHGLKNPESLQLFLANHGCGGCVTGIYPVSESGAVLN